MTNRFFVHTEKRGSTTQNTEIDLARVSYVYHDKPSSIYVYMQGSEVRLDIPPEDFISAWKSYLEG